MGSSPSLDATAALDAQTHGVGAGLGGHGAGDGHVLDSTSHVGNPRAKERNPSKLVVCGAGVVIFCQTHFFSIKRRAQLYSCYVVEQQLQSWFG